MKFGRIRFKTGLLVLALFMLQLPAQAGGWYRYSQNDSIEKFVSVTKGNSIEELYALGTNGQFAQSKDGGLNWELSNMGTVDEMRAMAIGYNWHTYSIVIIAVGVNGNVWRYDELTETWSSIDTLVTTNFNTVYFDYYEGSFWIGGEDGVIYSSNDYGLSWQADSAIIDSMNVKRFTGDAYYLFLIGDHRDSTFITYKERYGGNFNVADTIPGVTTIDILTPQGESYFSEYLLLGKESASENSSVWGISTNVSGQNVARPVFTGDLGQAQAINGYGTEPNYTLWVSNSEGQIFESRDWAESWNIVYEDEQHTALGPIVVSNNDGDHGRVFGANGLVLRYGLFVLGGWPFVNDQIIGTADEIKIHFSQVPKQQSLHNGIHVRSSLSGEIDYDVQYDALDSTFIYLHLMRHNTPGCLPGEHVDVVVDSELSENTEPFNKLAQPISYSFDLLAERNAGFRWKKTPTQAIPGVLATNYLTGLFNRDGYIDWVTFGMDTLYCFNGDSLNGPRVKKLYFPGLIGVDINMKTQLTSADIDNDGLLDLILYDRNHIYFLRNQSYGSEFNFSLADAHYGDRNIIKVLPYNKNNNAQIDLLVMSTDLYTIFDISLDTASVLSVVHEIQTGSYLGLQVGDINSDGYQDIVLMDPNGSLIFWRGTNTEQFYAEDKAYSGKQGYTQVHLADLDGNQFLEVLAADPAQVDVYTLYPESGWDFYTYPMRTIAVSNNTIQDFILHDFGGIKSESEMNTYFDLAILTQDSVEVYENKTRQFHNYEFVAHSDKNVFSGFLAKQILFADFNQDCLLDLAITSPLAGQFAILRKFSWQPQIISVLPQAEEVQLQWTPLPDSVGVLDFYLLSRSMAPNNNAGAFSQQVYGNDYTDYDIGPFQTRWYRIKAVYNGGIESDWSEAVLAETFIELYGEQVAALDDTTRPYWAKSDIFVPVGQNLQISHGVQIGFNPQTAFDIYGGLQITGGDTTEMVNLFPANSDTVLPWKGLRIHSAEDTVNLKWCIIGGAETGLAVENRPMRMKVVGIVSNQTGLDFSGDSLFMENVVFDSNMVAIRLGEQASAGIKNINILHSLGHSLIAEGQNRVRLRNAIIWDNQLPVKRTTDLSDVRIRFSTVDSVAGEIPCFAVSQLPPLFLPPDSGHFHPDYMSPTIDAGDPADDFSREPQPNGGRINQGLFGNLILATPSFQPRIRIEPLPVSFTTLPGKQDTIRIFIRNFGYAPLNVVSVTLKNNDPHFHLPGFAPAQIAANDSISIALVFRPQARAIYRDTLQIINNDPHLKGGIYLAALQGVGANSPPVITGQPLVQAKIASHYQYQIQVSDPDGDSLSFTPIELPGWLTISATGLISGVPTLADSGLQHVAVNISDGFGGQAVLAYDIQVGEAELERGPTLLLQSYPDGIVRESAVRFRFSIIDSNVIKGLTLPLPIRVHYRLRKLPASTPVSEVDTVLIEQIAFRLLEDGNYKLRVEAYYPADVSLHDTQELDFRVEADQRSTIKYRWFMVSLPREEHLNWDNIASRSDSSAILRRWDNAENKYLPLEKEDIQPGMAFWMMPLKAFSTDISAIPKSFSENASIDIQAGWNQIGVPRSYSTYWRQMRFQPQGNSSMPFLQAAKDSSFLRPTVFWFEQSIDAQGYNWSIVDSSTVAWPWKGYWLFAETPGKLFFPVQPAYASDSIGSLLTPLGKVAAQTEEGWEWNIAVGNGDYVDGKNLFGLSARYRVKVMEPPHMGNFCSISFAGERGNLTQLFKAPFNDLKEVRSWDMNVATQETGAPLTIRWQSLSQNDEPLYLYLVDLKNEKIINMHQQSSYLFTPRQQVSAFKLYVTQDESFRPQIIPLHFKLGQNYPNPFNPSTTIRVGIPQSSDGQRVTLSIYDVLGRKISVLWNAPLEMGYHEFKWNGLNDNGRRVASGIYFYRVRAGSITMIKKMILMR